MELCSPSLKPLFLLIVQQEKPFVSGVITATLHSSRVGGSPPQPRPPVPHHLGPEEGGAGAGRHASSMHASLASSMHGRQLPIARVQRAL